LEPLNLLSNFDLLFMTKIETIEQIEITHSK
jgi:hypothetical protein